MRNFTIEISGRGDRAGLSVANMAGWGRISLLEKRLSFDHIVVGGGTAGAIVAARLMEAGYRVAVFEAGPSDEDLPQVLNLPQWQSLLESELDFDYRIEPQPRGNGRIRHARGKVLGGCSSHNSAIAFIAPDYDLDQWAAMGAAGWEAAAVRPYWEKVRSKVHFEPSGSENPLGLAFVEAAEQYGLPFFQSLNTGGAFGRRVGWFDLNKRGDLRQSSSVAYLHPLNQWGDRLRLFTNSYVARVILDGRRAVGVETAEGAVYCEGEVIVCCGAIDSPTLLLRSGIGPAEELADLGIAVRHDLPGVGRHLLDHPEGVVNWEAARPFPAESVNFWELGLFETVTADAPCPDLMLHFGFEIFDMQTTPIARYPAISGFSMTPNVTRARSEGFIKLRSADAGERPLIDFRYFTDPEDYDERIMVAGVKVARRIAAMPGLRPWIKRELTPGAAVQSDRDISEYVRKTANTVYHPAGTCKMGAIGDETAVVDPHLRVRGLENLRVADASIFPTMTTVNPCVTVMMIGERGAELVIGDW